MQCSLLIVLIINRSCENCNFTIKRLISIAESYFRNKTRGLEYPAKLHKKNSDVLFYKNLFNLLNLLNLNNKTLEVANKTCS